MNTKFGLLQTFKYLNCLYIIKTMFVLKLLVFFTIARLKYLSGSEMSTCHLSGCYNKKKYLKIIICVLNVDANSHPSSLCQLSNTYPHNVHHLFKCNHIRTGNTLSPLDLWAERYNGTAGQMMVDHKREDQTPPIPTNKS